MQRKCVSGSKGDENHLVNSFLTLTGTRSPGVQSGGHRKLCLLTQKRLSRLLKVSPPSGTHNNKPFSLGSSYAVKAATEAMTCGRFFLAENPVRQPNSWESIEVKELLSLEVQCAYCCPCCWGGQRRGAQCFGTQYSRCWQSNGLLLLLVSVTPRIFGSQWSLPMARKSILLFSPESAGKKEPTPANTVVAFLKPSLRNLQLQKDQLALAEAVLDLGASVSVMGIEDHTWGLAVFSQMIWQECRKFGLRRGLLWLDAPIPLFHFHCGKKMSSLRC